jgi:hypothetical protein
MASKQPHPLEDQEEPSRSVSFVRWLFVREEEQQEV